MAVHRRQLPLAYPCKGFVPAPGSTGEGGFCERCQKEVHDVSAMRESELRRLLAAHAGGTVCLAYRTDAHGRVRLRPEPAPTPLHPLLAGTLALLLAACAGHATELEIPGATCRDEDGYAVSCSEWSDPAMQSVPESERLAMREVEDPPVRSIEPEPTPTDVTPPEPEPGTEPPPESTDQAPPAVEPGDAAPVARTDFEQLPPVEVDGGLTLGVVHVIEQTSDAGHWIEPDYVPTSQLIAEARARRAERKAARRRWWVARRRAAASR